MLQTDDRAAGAIDNQYLNNVKAADDLDLELRSKLGNMLLGPLAGQLGNRRLLVVTEGALQYVPFDALVPNASSNSKAPLLETNEVVVLPSISTLIAMRSARHHSNSTSKLLAVIADPVFSASDERLQSGMSVSAVAKAASDKNQSQVFPQTPAILIRDGALVRLAHASEEADAISTLRHGVLPWWLRVLMPAVKLP